MQLAHAPPKAQHDIIYKRIEKFGNDRRLMNINVIKSVL
jgi:hypothetical protein